MPNFKLAVAFCTLLLLMLVVHESVSAQSEERKIEVGAQVSGLAGGGFGDPDGVGGGGRLTFNLTKSLALEGELNYFPAAGFNNVRRLQGQFGVKSGFRFNRFGVFGKVRPGFIETRSSFTTCSPCPPGVACAAVCLPVEFTDTDTGFSLDVGGVAELYPSKRVIVRLDVGDTIANRQAPVFFINQPIFNSQALPAFASSVLWVPDVTTHNLQLSLGVGFRF